RSVYEVDCDRGRRIRRLRHHQLVAGDRPISPDDGDVMATRAVNPGTALREPSRILVAGIGNIFLGDDGFGVEVVRRLCDAPLPEAVEVADFGIRGVHLAYELAGGRYDTAILVDAVARGGAPGTVYAIEPDEDAGSAQLVADAHTLTPDAVLAWVRRVGTLPARIIVVGCEPASVEESMELSPPVSAAVERAIDLIRDLVAPASPEGIGRLAPDARTEGGAPCA